MYTQKRNKIELLDDLIDGLVKRTSGYPYNRIEMEEINLVNPKISEDILALHDKRVDIGYTSYPNNPEFDKYIQMGFHIIEFIAKNFDTEYGEAYLERADNIVKREEVRPFEKGSLFQSYISNDMYIVKVPLLLKENGAWKNHIWGSVYSTPLNNVIPAFNLGEGIYELYYQGNKIVHFQVSDYSISVVKEDKNFIELLKTEETREKIFISRCRAEFNYYDQNDPDFTFDDFVNIERKKVKHTTKHEELYATFQQFYPFYVEKKVDAGEDYDDYDCDNCRDGGCVYCSPQDFL